jgi:2-polyprenyl-3-methyl-5-hydroxy-6-metoxy-1,4-benzoquinol methylase
MNKYYEAYDLRYKRIHQDGLLWFKNEPTPELLDWILVQNVPLEETIFEVGCGEGRDVLYLASIGYKVAGTDVSEEAINICKLKSDENQLKIEWNRDDFIEMSNTELPSYNWIYSIGTLHMLVDEEDRRQFLANLHNRLNINGKLLLVSKGDGNTSFKTKKEEAFDLVERFHYLDDRKYSLEATSFCRKTWEEHLKEIEAVGFKIEKSFNSNNEFYNDCMIVYAVK